MHASRQQRLTSLIRLSMNARLQTLVRLKSDVPDKSQFQGRDHRSQYAVKLDTDFDNPKWINRHKWMFNWLDIHKDGVITLNEMVRKANDEVCNGLGATDAQREAHNTAVENFFRGAGMDYDKPVEWEQYLEGWKQLATKELEAWANNETTLIRQWGDAVFDIIDTNQNGSISLEEWNSYTDIAFAPMPGWVKGADGDAKSTFDICDLDDDGKIDVDELTRQHLGFWYSLDPTADGLYGKAVP